MGHNLLKNKPDGPGPLFTGPFAIGVIVVLVYCIDTMAGTRILASLFAYAQHLLRWG